MPGTSAQPTWTIKGRHFLHPSANLWVLNILLQLSVLTNEPTPTPAEQQTKARNKPHPPTQGRQKVREHK